MILNDKFKIGEKIMSVREMAIEVGVNPNTVMRSYELLQNKNIIINQRGIGFNVSENAKEIILEEQKKQFIEEELPEIIKKIKMFGISIEDVLKSLMNEIHSASLQQTEEDKKRYEAQMNSDKEQ